MEAGIKKHASPWKQSLARILIYAFILEEMDPFDLFLTLL